MSSSGLAMDTSPPPLRLKQDDLTPAEQAQLRIPAKRSFFRLRHSKSKHSTANQSSDSLDVSDTNSNRARDRASVDEEDVPFVKLGDTLVFSEALMEDYTKDVYRWAVLYENQRGATFFSTPYYSRLSLLPIDPPAFTLPATTKLSRRHQPTLTLSTYPLPDGSWQWVSRAWMVDMRGDGQTQYDGFEYNWHFLTKRWRSEVGFFSSGGWVRRRRWVRLMMRPAATEHEARNHLSNGVRHIPSTLEGVMEAISPTTGATRPPSVTLTPSDDAQSEVGFTVVWQGDAEEDWRRCHTALKRLNRDGRKLELWARWLCDLTQGDPASLPGVTKQWTEDEHPLPSQHMRRNTTSVDNDLAEDSGAHIHPADRTHVADVLRIHGEDIVSMFVYPDSRTHFLELLARSGLISELSVGSGLSSSLSMVEFWSTSQSLQNLVAAGQ